MPTTISVDELVAEIERLKRKGDDDKSWVSTKEIMKRTGMGQKQVLGMLAELKESGRLLSQKRPRQNLNGRMVATDCYQILPVKSGKSR